MSVSFEGKWIAVVPQEMPIVRAAERILDARLDAVARFLPLAAFHHREDVEYVHQLRVSCRRAAAAVSAFEPLLGGCRKRIERWLRRIRRAAGLARDADVLLQRWEGQLTADETWGPRVMQKLRDQREEAQVPLVDTAVRAGKGGFSRAIQKMLGDLQTDTSHAAFRPFNRYARRFLATSDTDLFRMDTSAASLEQLHRLRIEAKRLRYAIELFQSGLPPAVRNDDYPVVQRLQSRLGKLNDHCSAQWRCQQWLIELPPDGYAAYVARLVVGEYEAAQAQRAKFIQWWAGVNHNVLDAKSFRL